MLFYGRQPSRSTANQMVMQPDGLIVYLCTKDEGMGANHANRCEHAPTAKRLIFSLFHHKNNAIILLVIYLFLSLHEFLN